MNGDYNRGFSIEGPEAIKIYAKAAKVLKDKKSSEVDTEEVRFIKGLIRKGEARSTSHFIGLPDNQIHFMNLLYYETGAIEKNPVCEADIRSTVNLIV